MHRLTSVETYRQIVDEGLLPRMRLRVYDMIYHHGPINISQLILLSGKKGSGIVNTGSISGRISELVEQDAICEAYTAPCPVTKRNTIFWVTTANLPKERLPAKRQNKLERIKVLVQNYLGQEMKIEESKQNGYLIRVYKDILTVIDAHER